MGNNRDRPLYRDSQKSRELYAKGRSLMDEGRLQDAIETFEGSCRLMPHAKTLELLGECLMRSERYQEAIIPLAAATALKKHVRAPSLLAETFLKLNELAEARAVAKIALQCDSTNKKALAVLQDVETELGKEI